MQGMETANEMSADDTAKLQSTCTVFLFHL